VINHARTTRSTVRRCATCPHAARLQPVTWPQFGYLTKHIARMQVRPALLKYDQLVYSREQMQQEYLPRMARGTTLRSV
jgi:hypothetical protein